MLGSSRGHKELDITEQLKWTEWTKVVIKSSVNSIDIAEILPSHDKQSIMASVIINSETKNKMLQNMHFKKLDLFNMLLN